MRRFAFFISDGTGITAETLGESLLSQFENIEFQYVTLPYVDSQEKAKEAATQIKKSSEETGMTSIVVDTIVDKEIRQIIDSAGGFKVDIFATFLSPLEKELGIKSSYTVGRPSDYAYSSDYLDRISAVNFALDNDDGARTRHYKDADVILVGVSRSGKTPTCLYMAMQFGIKAANYPFTEEDMDNFVLPKHLQEFRNKLFGLTIDPERLSAIRNERRANSRYASIKQCYHEVDEVEHLFQREDIPYLNTTAASVEEISTRIMALTGLKRK